jgi:anti-sigma factor RsiW
MTCHDAREQLSALIDDALGAEERGAVEAHLATCVECRRELERLRGTVALLRAVEPARAPIGFVDRVLEAARPEPWPRRLFRALVLPWPVKLPIEAAAIVLVAVGVVYVFRSTPARLYDAPPPGAGLLSDTAPPSSDASREAARLSEATRAPEATRAKETARTREVGGPQEAARAQETERVPEAAKAKERDQAPEKQAPGQKALEKKSPEGPPAAKSAPAPDAFKEGWQQSKDADERRAKLDDAARDVAKRQANVPSATPAESQVAGKLEESPARAERSQEAAGMSARSSAVPAPEPRTDTLQAPRPATPAPAITSFVPPDVSGRLAVADRDAALQNLARLLARLGGVEDRRFVGDEGPIVELTIPRAAYPELLRELAALGRWQLVREAPALPEKVRVVLLITR